MSEPNETNDPLETLTVRQAAALLHVSRPTVEKYIKSGELPSLAIGRCRRIRRADLEVFLERRLTYDYSPMDNRHRPEGQHVPNQDGYLPDPALQDGPEGGIPF